MLEKRHIKGSGQWEKMLHFKDLERSLDFLTKRLTPLGIHYLSHGVKKANGPLSAFFTDKEWGTYYKKKSYFERDPLTVFAEQMPRSCLLWKSLSLKPAQQEIMDQRYDFCHIKNGVTLSLSSGDDFEIVALGSSLSDHDFYGCILQDLLKEDLQEILQLIRTLHDSFYNTTHKRV